MRHWSILFVCHGNICRSPMAEFVLRELVLRAGADEYFTIASAATSTEELGNPVYPPAARLLRAHGIDCSGKTARQITREDYDAFDLLIGMDRANRRNMERIFGGDPERKIRLLPEFSGSAAEIPDPWYSGEFDRCWHEVGQGCRALLARLLENGNWQPHQDSNLD